MNGQDILDIMERLQNERLPHEQHWRDVEEVVPPFTRRQVGAQGDIHDIHTQNRATRNRQASRKRYDTTMTRASEKLTAGMVSLIAPSGQKWHGLTTATVNDIEDEAERVWAEKLRDLMFFYRYNPKSRFEPALQAAMYSTVAYGPGYIYTDPTFSPSHVAKYRALPVDEVFVDKDEFGEVVGVGQRRLIAARNVSKDWNVSDRIESLRNNPSQSGQTFQFFSYITARDDFEGGDVRTARDSTFVGYIVEVQTKKIVYQETFDTFPVACFFWDDAFGTYGTSPCINYLLDQKTLNAMERDTLVSLQQIVRPPTAGPDSGLHNRPNLNPGAHNPGMVGPDGRPLLVPLLAGQQPERAVPFLEQRRGQIEDGLYNTLFQMLVDSGSQTATEVLQRANEKAQLLGPVGARMHMGMNMLIDREFEALNRRGLYAENSPYLPPETLEGQNVVPNYTNPMMRLQMASQAQGTIQMMEIDNAGVQMGKTSRLDDGRAFKFLSEAFDAPASILRTSAEIKKDEEAKAAQQQQQQGLEAVQGLASASKDALPAMEALGAVPSE